MAISVSLSLNSNDLDISAITPKIKRNKGKSLVVIPPEYILIDTETTGLSPEFDDLIEIACIKMNNGQEIGRFHSLIQPTASEEYLEDMNEDEIKKISANEIKTDEDGYQYIEVYVDSFITSLTGITNEMLETAPVFSSIAKDLWDFIGDSILVGHNINFDINFLYDNLETTLQKELKNNFIDTLRISRMLFPDFPNHKLLTISEKLEVADNQEHRALSDCLLVGGILKKIKSYIASNNIDLFELFKKKKGPDLTLIKGDASLANPDNPLYKANCVFTGTLEKMKREKAVKLVANIGGFYQNGINKKTNYLILGNFDYRAKGGKTNKLKKAEALILKGVDLKIIPEDIFYELVLNL
jgi:DNA polymerase-3 subunit epsilon